MRRVLTFCLRGALACLPLLPMASPSWAAEGSESGSAQVRVGVLPILPLSHGIKSGAGMSLRDLFAAELDRRGTDSSSLSAFPILFDHPAAPPASRAPESGADAAGKGACASCGECLERGAPERAVELCSRALAEVNSSPAADGAMERQKISDSWADLAVALAQRGRDEESANALRQAVLLSPVSPLTWESGSPRLSADAVAIRKSLSAGGDASLEIRSPVCAASVEVDGVSAGEAPVRVEGLLPGRHLVRTFCPGLGQGEVRMAEAQRSAPAFDFGIGIQDDETRLLSLTAAGRLDAGTAALASEIAWRQGASHLLGGLLVLKGDDLLFEGFVFERSSGRFLPLPRASFGAELLTAGLETARFMEQAAAVFTEGAQGTASLRPPPAPAVRRVSFPGLVKAASSASAEGVSGQPSSSPKTRRPIDPRRASGKLRDR